MSMKNWRFALGDKARCRVSGDVGAIAARKEYHSDKPDEYGLLRNGEVGLYWVRDDYLEPVREQGG